MNHHKLCVWGACVHVYVCVSGVHVNVCIACTCVPTHMWRPAENVWYSVPALPYPFETASHWGCFAVWAKLDDQ